MAEPARPILQDSPGRQDAVGATDRLLALRSAAALARANARYWTTVAPRVRRGMRRWQAEARAIEDGDRRGIALAKLEEERFNAEAAAMLATAAPARGRGQAVEAILALELMFDYLDGLTESRTEDPLGRAERLFASLIAALGPRETAHTAVGTAAHATAPNLDHLAPGDDPYLRSLTSAARAALVQLPAAGEIAEAALASAERAAAAQAHMHAAAAGEIEELQSWAAQEALGTGVGWREFLAGSASSVLTVHALIAAAADSGTTSALAEMIAEAYVPVCVVVTLLDGIVDRTADVRGGGGSYAGLYKDERDLAHALARASEDALGRVRALPGAPHHVMIFMCAIAYYATSPGAKGAQAKPHIAALQAQLGDLMHAPMLLLRGWRAARRFSGLPDRLRTAP